MWAGLGSEARYGSQSKGYSATLSMVERLLAKLLLSYAIRWSPRIALERHVRLFSTRDWRRLNFWSL